MTQQITGSAFVLAVHNIDKSAAFYIDALGFEDLHVAAPGWCFLQRDACRIHLGECPDALPAGDIGDHSYFAYLYVSDAEPLHARAIEQQAEVIKPLADEPWGMREFAIRTPDGHKIMVGERLTD